MCKTDWFKQYKLKFTIKCKDKFNICALSNVSIHNCICQLPQFKLIFPCSGVSRHTIYLQPIDRGSILATNRLMSLKIDLPPGKLFMQTDLWYTKLNLLNGDILIPKWECPTVSGESNTPPQPKRWCVRMYLPTQNAGVWDVTSLSNWHRLWF